MRGRVKGRCKDLVLLDILTRLAEFPCNSAVLCRDCNINWETWIFFREVLLRQGWAALMASGDRRSTGDYHITKAGTELRETLQYLSIVLYRSS